MSKDRAQVVLAFIHLAAQRGHLGDRVERAISAVLKHGQDILGPEIAAPERALASLSGARPCVTCANGAGAVWLALLAQGIGSGDAVFVLAITFGTAADAAVRAGGTPFFVNVRPDTFTLDTERLAAAI